MENKPSRKNVSTISVDTVRSRAPRINKGLVDYGMLAELTGFPLKVVWIIGYTLLTKHIDDPAITPQRYSMLELIGSNPLASQSRLGSALGLSRPATSLAIDFWQDRGCVERRAIPGDKRSFGIHLTEEGQKVLDGLRRKVRQSDAALTRNLTNGEIAQLRGLLAKIHE